MAENRQNVRPHGPGARVMKRYKFQFLLVLVCIVISVAANLQGTLFTRTLIDSYIMPLLASPDPDFGPLAGAIGRVALFYGAGILASFTQSIIMVYVTQGTILYAEHHHGLRHARNHERSSRGYLHPHGDAADLLF